MILLELLWLLLALCVFYSLKRYSFVVRVLISASVLLALTAATIGFVLLVGDPPPEGSIPMTPEVLEHEGMIEEEWEEHRRSVQREGEQAEDTLGVDRSSPDSPPDPQQ